MTDLEKVLKVLGIGEQCKYGFGEICDPHCKLRLMPVGSIGRCCNMMLPTGSAALEVIKGKFYKKKGTGYSIDADEEGTTARVWDNGKFGDGWGDKSLNAIEAELDALVAACTKAFVEGMK